MPEQEQQKRIIPGNTIHDGFPREERVKKMGKSGELDYVLKDFMSYHDNSTKPDLKGHFKELEERDRKLINGRSTKFALEESREIEKQEVKVTHYFDENGLYINSTGKVFNYAKKPVEFAYLDWKARKVFVEKGVDYAWRFHTYNIEQTRDEAVVSIGENLSDNASFTYSIPEANFSGKFEKIDDQFCIEERRVINGKKVEINHFFDKNGKHFISTGNIVNKQNQVVGFSKLDPDTQREFINGSVVLVFEFMAQYLKKKDNLKNLKIPDLGRKVA
jgi:hypothetical protein